MAVIDKGSYGYRGDEWVKDILGAVNQSGQINEWFHLMVETGASMRVGTAHTQHRYGCIIGPSLTLYEHFCAEVKKREKKTTLRYLWWLCGREVHWSAQRGDKTVNVPHPAEIFIGKNKEVIVCNRCAWNMIGVLKAFWASIYLETFTLPIKSCHRLRLCSPPRQTWWGATLPTDLEFNGDTQRRLFLQTCPLINIVQWRKWAKVHIDVLPTIQLFS